MMLHSFEEEAATNLGRALIKAFAEKGLTLTDGCDGHPYSPAVAGKPIDLSELVPDSERIVWFTFDDPEAKGAVGVRADNYGLGIYVHASELGLQDIDPGFAVRIASVDLFYRSEEGRRLVSEPFIDVVIDDMASEDICAVAVYRPERTVVDVEPENQGRITLAAKEPGSDA